MECCAFIPDLTFCKINNKLTALQKLLDSSVDVICSVDPEGRFITVNSACKKLWGYAPEELIGKYYIDLVVDEDKEATYRIAHAIMNGQETTNFENRFVRKDGSIVPVIWSARWDAEEQTMYSIAKDATEIHRQRQKETEYEQRLYFAYKLARIGWWEWDAITDQTYVSDELYTIYGLGKEETINIGRESYLQYIHPDDLNHVQQNREMCFQLDKHEYQHRWIKPDGEIIYVIHYVSSIRNKAEEIVKIYGTTKDITERKEQELAIIESREKMVNILESIQEGFFAVDKNWMVTYWNKKAEEILGQKKESIVGRNLWEVYDEAARLKFYTEYRRALEENIVVHFEEYLPSMATWFEVTAYPAVDGLSVYFKDITLRKKIQEEIKASEEKYKLLFYKSPTPKWVFDSQTLKFTDVNEAAIELYGYSKEEFMQMTLLEIRPKEEVEQLKQVRKQQAQKKEPGFRGMARHRKKNGEIMNIEVNCYPIHLSGGAHIAELIDLTEKMKLHQLVTDERIAAQKEISKAIIQTQEAERSEIGKELHDNVNQILTTAKLYIENIEYYPEKSKEFVGKSRELLVKSINEIRFLARQLVTPVIHDLGFKATIEELVAHYKALNIFGITLKLELDEKRLEKDMQLTMYRVIQEQLNNVVKHARASNVMVSIIQTKDSLEVLVQDDGIGFNPAKVSSGIGLKNINHRADLFKGKVQIRSAENEGCTLLFKVKCKNAYKAAKLPVSQL